MKFIKAIVVVLLCFSFANASTRRKMDYKNSSKMSLSVTHILPSAFVIPGGTLVLGTTLGAGFFDIFDISTNLYLDFYSVYNATVKVGVLNSENFALALNLSYVSQSVSTQSVDTATLQIVTQKSNVTATAPGMTFSYRISDAIVGHLGGKVVMRNPVLTKQAFTPKTGFVQGNTVNKEFAFSLSPETSFAVGASYDLSYDIPGAGASFYLGHFQIGLHYYFGVTEGAAQPILGGGYTASL